VFCELLVVSSIIAPKRSVLKRRFHNVVKQSSINCLLREQSRICYASHMDIKRTAEQNFALAFAGAWTRLERRLDNALGSIRGISLAEYRLLRALGDAPGSQASRVDLAQAVGLTPSGVTRALRPMEKLSIVSTVKSKRDARLAIAALTPAGRELLDDATGVVNDTLQVVFKRSPELARRLDEMTELLGDFSR
jgi:DNA-binding MarR family transcriptional regulator